MAFSRYRSAHRILRRISKAKAGGFSPQNLAALAAGILSLEIRSAGRDGYGAKAQLNDARKVMDNLLKGSYNGRAGSYRDGQRSLVQRQVASMLRILECVPGTSLSDVAHLWRSQFDSGNKVNLHVEDFNILLAAIVETKGANVGRMIWDLFCEDPREGFDRNHVHPGSHLVPFPSEDDKDDWESGHFSWTRDEGPLARRGYSHVPVLELEEVPLDEADDAVNEVVASDIGYEGITE